jgi:hypothetical protein
VALVKVSVPCSETTSEKWSQKLRILSAVIIRAKVGAKVVAMLEKVLELYSEWIREKLSPSLKALNAVTPRARAVEAARALVPYLVRTNARLRSKLVRLKLNMKKFSVVITRAKAEPMVRARVWELCSGTEPSWVVILSSFVGSSMRTQQDVLPVL